MPYYTGTANNMTALRQALIDGCTANGWTWTSGTEELSKGTMFIRVQVLADHVSFLGRTASGANPVPSQVKLGRLSTHANYALTYPLTYHLFVFAQEVYLVAAYNVDRFLWAAFGLSTIQGIPGTGMWCGASAADTIASGGSGLIGMSATAGGSISYLCPALFHNDNFSPALARNCWVNHNLEGYGWRFGASDTSPPIGVATSIPLLGMLPNNWNSEAVLLPLRAHVQRPSSKISMVVDCEFARITRIDNYTPGDIIQIGSDRWMIFPWYRKDSANRAGGTGIDHTGTFGWAIRYKGP
ncbi:hypothetical protein [Pseudomonas nitroreducens]|uniref:hypothetical protein n=1 Tax=Pseudomonas nitroreducens TaxID=46680 RepID=UPI002D80A098|nr:hypothetical protein [Pseudomonas nitroreducens]